VSPHLQDGTPLPTLQVPNTPTEAWQVWFVCCSPLPVAGDSDRLLPSSLPFLHQWYAVYYHSPFRTRRCATCSLTLPDCCARTTGCCPSTTHTIACRPSWCVIPTFRTTAFLLFYSNTTAPHTGHWAALLLLGVTFPCPTPHTRPGPFELLPRTPMVWTSSHCLGVTLHSLFFHPTCGAATTLHHRYFPCLRHHHHHTTTTILPDGRLHYTCVDHAFCLAQPAFAVGCHSPSVVARLRSSRAGIISRSSSARPLCTCYGFAVHTGCVVPYWTSLWVTPLPPPFATWRYIVRGRRQTLIPCLALHVAPALLPAKNLPLPATLPACSRYWCGWTAARPPRTVHGGIHRGTLPPLTAPPPT